MTQQEFEKRTGIMPTADEFSRINSLYMNTSMDKDDFCKDFKKYGNSEIIKQVSEKFARSEQEKAGLAAVQEQERKNDLAEFLIGKSRVYNDTDFRNEAVRLIGEKETIKKTIEMGLQLWDEDKYILLQIIG